MTVFGYHPPVLSTADSMPPNAGFGFAASSVRGTPFARSNLEGLGIVYRMQFTAGAASCNDLAATLADDASDDHAAAGTITAAGITLTAHATGSAGMSQSTAGTLYSVFHNGRCFLFETAVSVAGGLASEYPKTHPPVDESDARSHLDAIVRSLRFTAPLQPAPALTHFSDTASGIRFDYPSLWKQQRTPADIAAPLLGPADGSPPLLFVFAPQGTPLAETRLSGITFSWTWREARTYDGCDQIARSRVAHPVPTRTDGRYLTGTCTEFASTETTGCRIVHRIVDSTLTDVGAGSVHGPWHCLIVERTTETRCADSTSPGRPLTDAETSDLDQQLERIVQTLIVR